MEKINKWHVHVMSDLARRGFTDFTIFHEAKSIYARASMTVLNEMKVKVDAEIFHNSVNIANGGSLLLTIALGDTGKHISVRMPLGEINGKDDLESFVYDAVTRHLAKAYLDEIA